MYDVTYQLAVKQGGGWRRLNGEQVFSGNVWVVAANSTDEFDVTWEAGLLKGGEYRIVKPIVTADGIQHVAVEFTL